MEKIFKLQFTKRKILLFLNQEKIVIVEQMSSEKSKTSKANKLICVDEEVFALIKEKSEPIGTPNDFLRSLLSLPPKKAKVGRPKQIIK